MAEASAHEALLGEMPQKEGSGLVKVSRHKPLAFLPQQRPGEVNGRIGLDLGLNSSPKPHQATRGKVSPQTVLGSLT